MMGSRRIPILILFCVVSCQVPRKSVVLVWDYIVPATACKTREHLFFFFRLVYKTLPLAAATVLQYYSCMLLYVVCAFFSFLVAVQRRYNSSGGCFVDGPHNSSDRRRALPLPSSCSYASRLLSLVLFSRNSSTQDDQGD